MKLGIVILAAGQGTRMRSRHPKVLHTLAGRPLLRWVLDVALELHADRTCVVYGHGGERVPDALSNVDCVWALQAEQRGTGHAVMQAMRAMRDVDRVLVLYGDVPLIEPATLERLVSAAASTDLGVLSVSLPDPTGYGRIVRDASGQVLRIVEHKDADDAERSICEVNTGVVVADRQRLDGWLERIGNDNAQGEYYLTDIVALAVGDGCAVATAQPSAPEEVAGVNDRLQLAALERYHQRRVADELMRAGVTLMDPARLDVRGRLIAESDVTIDVNVLVEGEVRLGEGVRVGPNCVLIDCTVEADSQVLANSIIERAHVGPRTRIGPFARLRPEAHIAADAHVGNFVEIKKSAIGEGSKVNHLSYVGDSQVGEGVNIGAGTITCNYDGVAKHRTTIGDRAFIGSNTALVAPVEIGAGATIGAGSVITRSAPAEKLTLARARQATIDAWQRPQKKPSTEPGRGDS